MKEFVIFGKLPGDELESLLYSKAKTMSEAQEMMAHIEREEMASDCFISTFDPDEPVDINGAFIRAINI